VLPDLHGNNINNCGVLTIATNSFQHSFDTNLLISLNDEKSFGEVKFIVNNQYQLGLNASKK